MTKSTPRAIRACRSASGKLLDVIAVALGHRLAAAPSLALAPSLRQRRIETVPAARLVGALRAQQHAVGAVHQPLRVIGGIAAHHADRARLGDVLGDRQQLRHRLERLAEIILVEAGDDHAHAARGQLGGDVRQLRIEELAFVDARPLRCRAAPSPAARPRSCALSDGMRSSLCDTM